MARPEKNTVDYFPFICGEGKKMFYLEETYGNDGFATFVKLLRELANTEFHYLDLSKQTTKMFLAAKCKIDLMLLNKIINDLIDLEKFDKELWDNFNVIWCQDFIDSIQDAYKSRKNECITKQGLHTHLSSLHTNKPSLTQSEPPVKPQTILKKTIVEKTREGTAIEILRKHKPQALSDLWQQNHRQIKDKDKLINAFNSKMELEVAQGKITFDENELMPRFKSYVLNWISNDNDAKEKNQPNEKLIKKRDRF